MVFCMNDEQETPARFPEFERSCCEGFGASQREIAQTRSAGEVNSHAGSLPSLGAVCLLSPIMAHTLLSGQLHLPDQRTASTAAAAPYSSTGGRRTDFEGATGCRPTHQGSGKRRTEHTPMLRPVHAQSPNILLHDSIPDHSIKV